VRDIRWYRAVPLLDFLILAVLAMFVVLSAAAFPRRHVHNSTSSEKKNELNMNSGQASPPVKKQEKRPKSGVEAGPM